MYIMYSLGCCCGGGGYGCVLFFFLMCCRFLYILVLCSRVCCSFCFVSNLLVICLWLCLLFGGLWC